ncbi:MAG: GGDEF domain-containing protein [Kineosporiaceae bacterium]
MAQSHPRAGDVAVGATTATDVDEALLHEQVTIERTRLFMTGQRIGAVSAVLTPAYLAWLISAEVPRRQLVVWLVAVALAAVLSGGHAWAYLARPRRLPGLHAWRRRQVLFQAVIGTLWGSAAVWITVSPQVFVDVSIVTAFAFSIGVIGRLHYRSAVVLFTITLWLPPLVVLVRDGGPDGRQLAFGLVLLAIALIAVLGEASRQLVGGLEDRLRAAALAERNHVLATRDGLTGLFNRREGLRRLADRTGPARPRPADAPAGAIVLMDIDHFKQINDTYGHPVGDVVLQAVAGRLQRAIRSEDHLARVGGEEFLAILSEVDAGRAVAERMRQAVSAEPIQVGEHQLKVTVSLGLTPVRHGEDLDVVYARADAGLYRAKSAGRNQVIEMDPPPDHLTP